MLTSVVAAVDLSAYAAVSSGDYTYTVLDDETAEITKYTGSATEVNIPSSIDGYIVTSIGYDAFNGTSSLTSVTIPDSVTSIGDWEFYKCISLTSITIPGSVTSIGARAFSDCSSLKSVTIGDRVTSIGDYAFYGCTSLTSVTIGNSVTSIGNYAFYSCSSLTSVTIPNSVTSIGERAFCYCTSLTSVTIPNSVTSMGDYAFAYCTNLINVTIEDGVIKVGEHAFCYCESLTSVTIPDSVTRIGWSAFGDCTSLTDVYYSGSEKDWNKIHLDESCIGDYDYLPGVTIHFAICTTHTWNSGKTTTAATCTSTGVKTYTCTVCGTTKTEKIAKKSHSWEVKTKGSATNKKSGSYKCKNCGSTKKLYYPKTMSLSTTSYTYNAKAKKPTVTIKDSNGSKISSKYYTVKYINQSTGKTVSSMKNSGKYYVKVTFKTRYSGSIKKAVTIKPKKTSIKSIKASSKGFTVKWSKVSTQNTGYQVQYSTSKSFKNAKTVTIKKTGTTSKKVTKLKAKKKYYVRVRTYKTVKINGKSTKIYSSWSSVKGVTTKK